jgi:hypothetical protein
VLGTAGPVLLGFVRSRHSPAPVCMGILILCVYASFRWGVLPLIEFAPSKQLTACILEKYSQNQEIKVWASKRQNYTRQLYMLSKGKIIMHYFQRKTIPANLNQRFPMILTQKDKKNLETMEHMTEPCGRVFRTPEFKTIWHAIFHGEKNDILNAMSEPLYLVMGKSAYAVSDRDDF